MRATASGWDIAIVEGVGLLAAALAAAASLRHQRQLQALRAADRAGPAQAAHRRGAGSVGLLLMRGGFVPGLSDLDSSGQIIAWAVVLGYSQQLLTRFVDQRALTVLDNFGRPRGPRAAPRAGGRRAGRRVTRDDVTGGCPRR